MTCMHIRIDAVDLPGLTCPPEAFSGADVPEYRNIHVAVQRRDRPTELLAPQPGDAVFATWTLLLLDAVPVEVLDASAGTGLLVGRLGLTDVRGGPLCARVVPPHITWTAEPADAED